MKGTHSKFSREKNFRNNIHWTELTHQYLQSIVRIAINNNKWTTDLMQILLKTARLAYITISIIIISQSLCL